MLPVLRRRRVDDDRDRDAGHRTQRRATVPLTVVRRALALLRPLRLCSTLAPSCEAPAVSFSRSLLVRARLVLVAVVLLLGLVLVRRSGSCRRPCSCRRPRVPSGLTLYSSSLASPSSTYALKRARSASTARLTKRIPEAIFSIIPWGTKSMSTITRVRFFSIRWKVTTPACAMPLVVFQAIRSFLRRSVISPSQWRVLNQIFSSHLSVLSSFSTFRTRCMKFGNSSKWVHRSYTVSTGAATSVQRWIGSRRVFFELPPPPLAAPFFYRLRRHPARGRPAETLLGALGRAAPRRSRPRPRPLSVASDMPFLIA